VEKYWPEDRWGQVINRVRALQPDHAVFLTGTTNERAFNEDIRASSGATEVYNMAGDLEIQTLLPLLERAHSIISVDTGPAHAAAALGCPTVALFGPANATLFRPGGATTPATALTGTVNGIQSILGITVDAVIEAWTSLIGTTEVHRAI
jgi:heptosyltransferase-2/heptosyltransferase-3